MQQPTTSGFAHRRLDAYERALDLCEGTVALARSIPRGFGDPRDQLQRSALAIPRHIAEGANRATAADKRSRFVVARGECSELDASLETAGRLGLVPVAQAQELHLLADRVGAMLTGLVRRHGAFEGGAEP